MLREGVREVMTERQVQALRKELDRMPCTTQSERIAHARSCETVANSLYHLGEFETGIKYWEQVNHSNRQRNSCEAVCSQYSQHWADRAEAAEFLYQQHLLAKQLEAGLKAQTRRC